eukprot:Nk52_evm1s2381 gene=Nk52_evmTU1s2381
MSRLYGVEEGILGEGPTHHDASLAFANDEHDLHQDRDDEEVEYDNEGGEEEGSGRRDQEDYYGSGMEAYQNGDAVNRAGQSGGAGPKGVLKDYRNFKEDEKKRQMIEAAKLLKDMNRFSLKANEDSDDFDLDEMDDFEKEYRRKKALEMGLVGDELQAFIGKGKQNESTLVQPMYGSVESVDKSNFLDVVDGTVGEDTLVLVMLYSRRVTGCARLLNILKGFASQHPEIRCAVFNKDSQGGRSTGGGGAGYGGLLGAVSGGGEDGVEGESDFCSNDLMHDSALPCILSYVNGKLTSSFFRILMDVSSPSVEDLEDLLVDVLP